MYLDMIEIPPVMTNCYLIGDETENACAVVDPGGAADKVLEMVKKSGMKLEKILLTHGHYDHVGGVDALAEAVPAPGVAIYLHPADTKMDDARLFPPLSHGFNHFEDGEIISVGSQKIRVLHTPGHSPGSVTLLAQDVMFCGDTLFAGSCGRCDLLGGCEDDILKSLKRLAGLKGEFKVCPGHGRASLLSREREYNMFMRKAMRL